MGCLADGPAGGFETDYLEQPVGPAVICRVQPISPARDGSPFSKGLSDGDLAVL